MVFTTGWKEGELMVSYINALVSCVDVSDVLADVLAGPELAWKLLPGSVQDWFGVITSWNEHLRLGIAVLSLVAGSHKAGEDFGANF